MPSTYNGTGTHYYGRRNAVARPATCSQCNNYGNLVSYDTRLWFVVFFIPVIPLGRKRVIDQCPRCTRHYIMDLAKWEAQKQLDVSGAAEKFRDEPTPDAAIAVHQNLVGYQQMAEAAEFEGIMLEKFPDNARICEYLGLAYGRMGNQERSEKHFQRAFELRPDLPNARAGVAGRRIREGRLEEARQLLDFLEKPGARQLYSLGPLEDLADGYRAAGKKKEALELYRHLLSEVPEVGQHPGFRGKVEDCERAQGERQSALPKKQSRWFGQGSGSGKKTNWKPAAVVVLLIILGFAIGNEWVRRHRRVHVMNGFAKPLTVTVNGAGSVTVAPGTVEFLELGEGDYRAAVTGAEQEAIDFSVRADYFSRWFSSPAWVLNPGGVAIVEKVNAVYSAVKQPSTVEYHAGQTVMFFPKVDKPFVALPQSLSMKSSEGSRTLVGLAYSAEKPADVFGALTSEGRGAEALQLAEARLRVRPDDEEMLEAYLGKERSIPAALATLKQGLDFRPVVVQWHRAYQSLARTPDREKELVVQYDAMLAREPKNASLLYLRGRLGNDADEEKKYYEQAEAIEPGHPWVQFAMGYHAVNEGDLSGALALLDEAAKVRPKDRTFRRTRQMVAMLAGKPGDVVNDAKILAARNGEDGTLISELCRLLAATGQLDEALKEAARFSRRLATQDFRSASAAEHALRFQSLSAAGDFAGAEKEVPQMRPQYQGAARFSVQLGQLQVAEAMKTEYGRQYAESDGFHRLELSVAWHLAGKEPEAAKERAQAAAMLAAGSVGERGAAALLQGTAAPTTAQLKQLIIGFDEKAALCVALGQQFPAARAALNAQAKQLNCPGEQTYHLLRQAIEKP